MKTPEDSMYTYKKWAITYRDPSGHEHATVLFEHTEAEARSTFKHRYKGSELIRIEQSKNTKAYLEGNK